MGCIRERFTDARFGSDIRDRARNDGTHWLNDEIRAFFDGRADENNPIITAKEKKRFERINNVHGIGKKLRRMVKRILFK
jgi:hypothetical protein